MPPPSTIKSIRRALATTGYHKPRDSRQTGGCGAWGVMVVSRCEVLGDTLRIVCLAGWYLR
jgi:hypothetical protein